MTDQHSPGPWRVTAHKTIGDHKAVKVENKDRVIFDGFQGEEANANLASAAPELLTALQGMLEVTRDQSIYDFMRPQRAAAEAAINKALAKTTTL